MDKSRLDETIKGIDVIYDFFGFRLPSQNGVFEEYRKILTDAMAFLKTMYEQIEDTHSCRLCANYNKCSPDAQFDTPEYQMFAGCRGSLKENWCWKGVDDE